MSLLRIAIAFLAFAAAASAQAGESAKTKSESSIVWTEMPSEEGTHIYVDRSSIKREGSMVRYRGRMVFPRPDENKVVELRHIGLIDCGRRDFRIVSFEAFNRKGRLVASHTVPASEPPQPIGPNTPNEALRAEFCS